MKNFVSKLYWGLFLKIKNLIISFKNINKIHIGSIVVYEGEEYFVNNGTRYPVWDLIVINGNSLKEIRVHEKLLKKKVNFKELKHSALSHYKWYIENWYRIQLKEKMNCR